MRVFIIERTFHQTEGWDGAWTSPLECCAPQALVEKRPYIYMGGYDPKVIKNREKLHFFFTYPSFCFLHLPIPRYFLVNCALHPCELVATSPSPALTLQRFSPSFFRKISVVFAQTIHFLEISALRGKTPPSLSLKISSALSLKTSVVRPQKSPPHEVQRGLVIVFRGRPSQRCLSASLKTRGIRSKRGSISTLLIAKFRALLDRHPASVPTAPHRAQ